MTYSHFDVCIFDDRYGNQMFVNYSIKCKEGEVAYMDVGHLDLEEANCLDPTLNEERFFCMRHFFNNFILIIKGKK